MREPVEFSVPEDWNAQLENWTAERGPEWRAALDQWVRSRGSWGRTMNWTTERVYELVYLWNEQQETAANICLWWVQLGYLPYKDDPKKGLVGNGHIGVISGPVKRMQIAGILDKRGSYGEDRVRNAVLGKQKPVTQQSATKAVPNLAKILEQRRQRVAQSGGAFDSLTREERGMPSAEIAQEQHPDYPAGITRDAAFRIEHGRTNLFTVEDSKRLTTSRRFLELCEALDKGVPAASDYDKLKATQKDLIQLRLKKTIPALRDLLAFLESLSSRGLQTPGVPADHWLPSE